MRRHFRLQTILILTVITLGASSAWAAIGAHQWSNGYAAGGTDDVDGTGAVASAGFFSSSASWGGPTLTALGPYGDMYLVRHSTSGAHLWSKQFTPDGFMSVSEVAADETGNIFVAGTLGGGGKATPGVTVDFGGGPLTGNFEMFLAGFDSNGDHLFSFVAGSGFYRDLAARGGHVAATGYTYGTVDFQGGSHTTAGGADVFVASLTTNGSHVWSSVFGDTASQGGMSIALDGSGSVHLVANTEGTTNFGGGDITPGPGSTALNIVKFTTGGSFVWDETFEGKFNNGAGILATCDIDVSSSGKIALAGHMNNAVSFGGATLSSAGSGDMYVAQFDASGAHQWSFNYGGNLSDECRGVSFDPSGNVFVAGGFSSANCTFGGGSFTPNPASFYPAYFLALYDASGVHVWSEAYGDDQQSLIRAHTDPQGNLVATGGAGPGLDMGGGPLVAASLFHAEFEGEQVVTAAVPTLRLASLDQNVPNPFNPSTTIRFSLPVAGYADLAVYDVAGRRIAALATGQLSAGSHEYTWTGLDDRGRSVASDVYYYRLMNADGMQTRKMVLLK